MELKKLSDFMGFLMPKEKKINLDEEPLTAIERDTERLKRNIKKTKKEKEKQRARKTTIQTIPYLKMEVDNITVLEKNLYSKTWEFSDINYSIMKQEEQEDIFIQYGKILNYFNSSVGIQINILNKSIDINKFKREILYTYADDDKLGVYKKEYNDMLLDFTSQKANTIERKKYVTLSIKRESDITQVVHEFKNFEEALNSNFKALNSKIKLVTNYEKVNILKDIFQGVDAALPELTQSDFNKQLEKNFISPDYFSFKNNYFMFNNTYARVMILRNLPSFLGDNMVNQLSEIDSSMSLTINIRSVLPEVATKIVNRKLTSIEADKIKYAKRAVKNNLPTDILPRDMEHALNEAREILDDMMTKNEKMFRVNLIAMVFDETFEGLEHKTQLIKNIASQNVCQFGELALRQEDGMASCLPIGYDKLDIKRTLTTNSTAILNPFNVQGLNTGNGIFYGINPRSNQAINANRKDLLNANGFILGTSGSGKSVSAKDELSQIFWKYPEDDIIIIDPEGEYVPIAEEYEGESLKVSANSSNYVNPLDLSESYLNDKGNPLSLKNDFMITLCEVCCGEIDATERSLIDRVMGIIYEKYLTSKDKADIPTLVEFYNELKKQGEIGERLATKMEIYCVGSQNLFAHKTNINIHNRFFVYNIKELNPNLKALGMLIMLDNIMNTIATNHKNGKATWLFLDELHILLKYKQSAIFLETLFKIARKWNGIPTGITQNIEDLLQSENGRKMLGNAEYIKLLKQKPQDRIQIAELLEISDNQIEYVNNADRGCGLIVWGNSIIPFKTKIPAKTQILKLWGTSASDG